MKTCVDGWMDTLKLSAGARQPGSANSKQGRQRGCVYLDARLAEGGRHPQVVGVRNLDVTEVVFVGDTPDAEVVYVVHCQVLRQLEFDVLALVGS